MSEAAGSLRAACRPVATAGLAHLGISTSRCQIDPICALNPMVAAKPVTAQITAAPRAFSLTSRITQRDVETKSGRSEQPRPPTCRRTEPQPLGLP